MADFIDLPAQPSGRPEDQLQTMYSYLYRMAKTMNLNLQEIGGAALTDEEQELMNQLIPASNAGQTDENVRLNYQEQQTLKGLIIKTADFVKTQLDAYNLVLFGETEASGQFGDYRLKKGLRVDVNPDGIKQTYSFAEVVKGLKTYEINAKNYIKTGYLRTENNVPIYGVAIGRDVVTFAEDGTETYVDGNKVAELTADELSFYTTDGNGHATIMAKYAGNRIGFYNAGTEVLYIDTNGIHSSKPIKIGNYTLDQNGLSYEYFDGFDMREWFKIEFAENEIPYSGGVYTYPSVRLTSGKKHEDGTWWSGGYGLDITEDGTLMGITNGNGPVGKIGAWNKPLTNIYAQDISGGTYVNNVGYFADSAKIKTIQYINLQQASSRDVKHDIQDMPEMGERLDQLRPVTFVYDWEEEDGKRAGLIYEETMQVMPEICSRDEGNKAINYTELIPMLLKEIQDLRKRVSELERRE